MHALRCYTSRIHGPVAQSVEQRIENPCVGGSIPPQATSTQKNQPRNGWFFFVRCELKWFKIHFKSTSYGLDCPGDLRF